MSLTPRPPVPLPRWQPGSDRDPEFTTALKRLRALLDDTDSELGRTSAVFWLTETGWPGAVGELGRIVDDEDSPAAVRQAAVRALWRLGGDEALDSLRRAAADSEPVVRRSALKALGALGSAEDRELTRHAQTEADDPHSLVAEAGRFAESLIEHRHDLPGEGDHAHLDGEQTGWTPTEQTARVPIRPARPDELGACLRDLRRAPSGIELSPDRAYEIECLRRRLMVTFRDDLPSPERLAGEKALLAVVAGFEAVSATWYPAYLLLTAPGAERETVHGVLRRTSGRIVAHAEGRVERGTIQFRIAGYRRPGSFPLTVRGRLDTDYRLEIDEAEVGPSTEKLAPRPYVPLRAEG
ncbi:MAG: HEAT repeat domain-containing protein [Acidobacteriota bacterium]|nr:HEAT repeat domain-containing protein [Acidobacteriota bacterium]